MSDEVDWGLTTWEGSRRVQQQEFHALPFREKLLIIEQMEEIAECFRRSRASAPEVPPSTG
jgi:hypothetical protein